MQQSYVSIGGNRIATYESGGSGDAILLIHGRLVDAGTFAHQLGGDFGQNHRVVAFDLPGHGSSPPAVNPEAVYSAPGFANIVVKLVDQLNLHRSVIVGWSLGGGIVLEAATRGRTPRRSASGRPAPSAASGWAQSPGATCSRH